MSAWLTGLRSARTRRYAGTWRPGSAGWPPGRISYLLQRCRVSRASQPFGVAVRLFFYGAPVCRSCRRCMPCVEFAVPVDFPSRDVVVGIAGQSCGRDRG